MDHILDDISQAAQGLYVMSETDAPLEPLDLGFQPQEQFSQQQLLLLLGKPADSPLEVQELPYFLRNMTKVREGDSEQKQKEARRFEKLQETVLTRLSEVKVYRVGVRQIEAFLLGWTPDKRLVGLKTLQVET